VHSSRYERVVKQKHQLRAGPGSYRLAGPLRLFVTLHVPMAKLVEKDVSGERIKGVGRLEEALDTAWSNGLFSSCSCLVSTATTL